MMRKERPFLLGDTKYDVIGDNVYAFARTFNSTTYIIALNFGQEVTTFDLTVAKEASAALSRRLRGYVSLNTLTDDTRASEGQVISLKTLSLVPGQGIVLKTIRDDPKKE